MSGKLEESGGEVQATKHDQNKRRHLIPIRAKLAINDSYDKFIANVEPGTVYTVRDAYYWLESGMDMWRLGGDTDYLVKAATWLVFIMADCDLEEKHPRFCGMPVGVKNEIDAVFTYGAIKYAPGNWHTGKGFDWDRLDDAMERHLDAWILGETIDQESGYPHLAHAGCCITMLLEHVMTSHGTDTRSRNQYIPNLSSAVPDDILMGDLIQTVRKEKEKLREEIDSGRAIDYDGHVAKRDELARKAGEKLSGKDAKVIITDEAFEQSLANTDVDPDPIRKMAEKLAPRTAPKANHKL